MGRVLGRVYLAVCRLRDVAPSDELLFDLAGGLGAADSPGLEPPGGVADPRLLGDVHEALMAPARRSARGAFYTPEAVARRVVGWALATAGAPRTGAAAVCDPTCGGGSFLLAAADALEADGADRRAIVGERLHGADLDPLAVAVARAALGLWAGAGSGPPREAVVVADVLAATPRTWATPAAAGGFTAVVGNPPFLGQLSRTTSRSPEVVTGVRERFGGAVGAYTDTAALVLLAALDLAAEGGAVALLQPGSFLAARDTEPVRRVLAERSSLACLWLAGTDLFDAGGNVCVPVLKVGPPSPAAVTVRTGARAEVTAVVPPPPGAGWAALAATATGVPDPPLRPAGVLGDWCTATAGFRDEYYGLVPLVEDVAPGCAGDGLAPLVTSGLIDPARCTWGRRPARFARRRWDAPGVRVDALEADARLGRWLRRCLVPKLVVATQTSVLEAAVDEDGRWVPCTPVISVECAGDRLWHAAAVLLSPVATAWALRTTLGTALSSGAVKPSARQVLSLPSPPPGAAWDRAADAVRRAAIAGEAADADAWRAALHDAGRWSCRAFGVPPGDTEPLLAWWSARLPAWR